MAAAAHGDTGVLELVSTEPVDDDSVHYVVELTYENDGEHVSSAEVVLTTADAAPIMMTADGDGLYSATVDFPSPGDYELLFTVDEPTAELAVEQVVEATTSTTLDDTTMTTTTADPSTVAATTTGADAEGGSTWLLVVMAVIVATMITVAVAYFRGRKQRQQQQQATTTD